MTRPWKPRVSRYTHEAVGYAGETRWLPPEERWFVEREWWKPQKARRFPCWEYAMAYANHLPQIKNFEENK